AADDTTAPSTAADRVPSGPEDGYAALQHELESLRMENTQLKRKLAERVDQQRSGANAELERKIEELERRNRSLNEALEKRGGRDDEGGGWFGRRKG
ncbi:MAG: hypothetical protein WD336_04590, partial [Trueperaceae bacterium]